MIFSSLRVRASQGKQFIDDVTSAVPTGFRGLPILSTSPCEDGCRACADVCPTTAITTEPLRLDLGRCVFCDACADACPPEKIAFTAEPKMASSTREGLVVVEGAADTTRVRAHATFAKLFGRSLRLRQLSAGGCNACELELNASANVNFDVQRYGIDWVASPRHADGLVVTGPLTKNMRDAVRITWDAMPEPRFVVAVGACAISGGLYEAGEVDRSFFSAAGMPALFVPGCPPHPLTFANALLDFLDLSRRR